MKCFIILFIIFISGSIGSIACNTDNDPEPNGGGACAASLDCNSINGGGVCDFSNSTGVCVCSIQWGKPDCSYHRTDKGLAGGLQIGLLFAGIGGVGNFVIGRIGPAVGQLIMFTCIIYIGGCIGCCAACCAGGGLEILGAACGIFAGVIVLSSILASFIWSIVDGAYILQCKLPDAAGYALY